MEPEKRIKNKTQKQNKHRQFYPKFKHDFMLILDNARKMTRKFKNKDEKPFSKDKFEHIPQIHTYGCPNGLILDR